MSRVACLWARATAVLENHNLGVGCVRASHDQVYGGGLIFQSQTVRAFFGGFEVFCRRSPAAICVEEVLAEGTVERIIRDLVFLETAFVANPPSLVAQVQLSGGAIAHGAGMILLPHRLRDCGKLDGWINLAQQLLNHLLALFVSPLTEVCVAQVAVFIKQILGRPIAVGKGLPDFAVAVDDDRVCQAELANARAPRSTHTGRR